MPIQKRIFEIYLLTEISTGKQYVGQHSKLYGKNDYYFSGGKIIKSKIKKYGKEIFKKEIIKDNVNCQSATNLFEEIFIKKYNTIFPNGYNIQSGGKSQNGFHLSDETKKKLSEAHKGRKFSKEHKEKISEQKKKLIGELNPFFGKNHSEEYKIKSSLKRRKINKKLIFSLYKEGLTQQEIAKKINVNQCTISRTLNKKRNKYDTI